MQGNDIEIKKLQQALNDNTGPHLEKLRKIVVRSCCDSKKEKLRDGGNSEFYITFIELVFQLQTCSDSATKVNVLVAKRKLIIFATVYRF